uniref:Superoxide dismutase [Cu-Zn] n=1 Tax=Takifugu rubripes TaxID=31033 RepID=A0A674MAJ2_TAKRU
MSASALAALMLLLADCQRCVLAEGNGSALPEASQNNGSLYASCNMRRSSALPEDVPQLYGHVLFKQDRPQGILRVLFHVGGFLTDPGCGSTRGHYNPYGENHPNHPGDFGNFVPQEGIISAVVESKATLFGGMSAIGRAVVVHEKNDDLGQGGDAGSLLHGNAGRRLACCVIGISSPDLWNLNYPKFAERMKKN